MSFRYPLLLAAALSWSLAAQPASVRVAPLSELTERVEYSAPAEVTSDDHSLLSAQLDGLVEQVRVQVGDRVSAGQLLVQLDCRDYDFRLRQAQSALDALDAQIRLARLQLARAETLLRQRNAPLELRDQRQAELDSLQAQWHGARVQVDSARLAVERCQVRAPFDAVVTERPVAQGSLANIGTPLLRLLRGDRLEVAARLGPDQVDSLQQGHHLRYHSAGEDYPLELRAVLPLVNSRSRTQEVRLSFSDGQALSGSSGRLVWSAARSRVPAGLLVRRGEPLGLMLYNDGQSRFHPLPQALEGQAAIVELPGDTMVIIEGQHAVRDGDAVDLKD